MEKFAVQGLNQLDAITQGCVDRVFRFVFEVGEFLQAIDPVALTVDVALMTAIAGGVEEAVVRAVTFLDNSLHE
jgi:hypothetical protein